jgi:alpha-D-xyloside xylohydrolase
VSDLFYPLGEDEAFYGLGQHQNGVLNYRGTLIELAQVNTDVAVPLLVSSKGYGVLWNTAAKSEFDHRFVTEVKLSASAAHAIDYYFLYGPEIDQIIHQYRLLPYIYSLAWKVTSDDSNTTLPRAEDKASGCWHLRL